MQTRRQERKRNRRIHASKQDIILIKKFLFRK